MRILVLTEKTAGGEWIATERFLQAFKRKYGVSYKFLILRKREFTQAPLGMIRDLFRYFFYARGVIRQNITWGEFDSVLVSDYLWALAVLSLKPGKIKLVFLFHGLRSSPIKKFSDLNYRQIIIKILERMAWTLSNVVVVPSRAAEQYIKKAVKSVFYHSNVILIPNIVPADFYSSKKTDRKKDNYTILYSGRIGEYKGLENLAIAVSGLLSKIPSAKLAIAYPSSSLDPRIYSKLKQIIKHGSLGTHVKFVKDVEGKDLAKLYCSSDVLVLPSDIEFAPMSVIESMACGTPVIATKVGNIGILLKNVDPRLILKNNSPAEIENKLLMFYRYSNAERLVLSKRSKKIAEDFSEAAAQKSFSKVLPFLQSNNSR